MSTLAPAAPVPAAQVLHIAVSREFSYRGVPPGCRKPRTLKASYADRLSVRVATAAEAPVLCEIDQTHRTWRGGEDVELSTSTIIYRAYDGRVWSRNPAEESRNLGASAATTIGAARTWDMHEEEARHYLGRILREMVDCYLVIDGDIYEVSEEPAYSLSHSTSFSGDSLTIAISTEPKGQHVYRLDERAVLDADRPGYIEDHALSGRCRRSDDSTDEVVIYDDFTVRNLRADLLRRPSISHHRTAERVKALAKRFSEYVVESGLRGDLASACDRLDESALPPGVTAGDLLACRDAIERLYRALRSDES